MRKKYQVLPISTSSFVKTPNEHKILVSFKRTGRNSPKQLVLLDVGYIVDNVGPPFQGEKRVVFLIFLTVVRMVIWETRNKGLYDGANLSPHDLILFLGISLGSRLDAIVNVWSAKHSTKGVIIGVTLPSSSCSWRQ